MTIREIRKQFEYLTTGKIYFNHASVGPLPKKTVDTISDYLVQRSRTDINVFMHYLAAEKEAKKKLAKLLGCETDRLAWTDNVGNSMSMLAQGLQWQTGDRIILNNIEFPSNVYPFLNLKNQGVEVDFVDASDGMAEVKEYEKLITPKTKIISVSLVQFLSGYKIDIKALGELCQRHGIILAVDAIQATGAVQIKAADWKIDFLTGGTQKWLMGLEGLSYIYITEELQERINQRFVGWGSVKDSWELLDYNLDFPQSAKRFQNGTPNVAGVLAANSSFDLFIDYTIENVERRIKENTRYLIEKLSEIGYSPILKNQEDFHLAGIVTFDSENADKLKNELAKRDMIIEVRVGRVRISPHFYNTKEEMDAIVKAIKEAGRK